MERRFIKDRIDEKAHYGYVFGKTYEEADRKLKRAVYENMAYDRASSFSNLSDEWLLLRVSQLKASSIAKYRN